MRRLITFFILFNVASFGYADIVFSNLKSQVSQPKVSNKFVSVNSFQRFDEVKKCSVQKSGFVFCYYVDNNFGINDCFSDRKNGNCHGGGNEN